MDEMLTRRETIDYSLWAREREKGSRAWNGFPLALSTRCAAPRCQPTVRVYPPCQIRETRTLPCFLAAILTDPPRIIAFFVSTASGRTAGSKGPACGSSRIPVFFEVSQTAGWCESRHGRTTRLPFWERSMLMTRGLFAAVTLWFPLL